MEDFYTLLQGLCLQGSILPLVYSLSHLKYNWTRHHLKNHSASNLSIKILYYYPLSVLESQTNHFHFSQVYNQMHLTLLKVLHYLFLATKSSHLSLFIHLIVVNYLMMTYLKLLSFFQLLFLIRLHLTPIKYQKIIFLHFYQNLSAQFHWHNFTSPLLLLSPISFLILCILL